MPALLESDLVARSFWVAVAERRLSLPKCSLCGRYHFYPRPFCPFCWSEELCWNDVSGRGTLYTYSIIPEKVPHIVAMVDLAEGPRLMTTVIGCEPKGLWIGMSLEVDFVQVEGKTVPVFRPVL